MHNHVSIMGNLTRDPELRFAGETPICKFGIALNERYKKKSGEEVDNAHFFDCVAFGRTAETIEKYFEKGKPIIIDGTLSYSSWEDRESGSNRSKVEIKVMGFTFLPRNDGEGGGRQESRRDDRRGDPRDDRRDDRRGSSNSSSNRDDTRQHRDDRNDGRDAPAKGDAYDFDDIPF